MTASPRVAGGPALLALLALSALCALLASGPAQAYGKSTVAPSSAAAASQPQHPAQHQPQGQTRPSVVRLVDLNSASRDELTSLPGIDDAVAERIVAARPYPSKAKLVAEQVISVELFLRLKNRVVAVQQPVLRVHHGLPAAQRP